MYLKSCALLLCSCVSMLSAIVTPGFMPESRAACSTEISLALGETEKKSPVPAEKAPAPAAVAPVVLYYAFPGGSAPVFTEEESKSLLRSTLGSPVHLSPCG